MYLVSLYFDEMTNSVLNQLKDENRDIPNHITVASFDTDMDMIQTYFSFDGIVSDEIHFVSLGLLGSDSVVVYVVLNECLHTISKTVHEGLKSIPDVRISQKYRVWGWIPHVTLASHCSNQQIHDLLVDQKDKFTDFKGKVVRIGISTTRPYKEIIGWDLKEEL